MPNKGSFKDDLLANLSRAKNQPYDIQELILKHCRNNNEADKTLESESRSRIYNRILLDLKKYDWIDFHEPSLVRMCVCHFEPNNPDPFHQGPHIVWLTTKGEMEYKNKMSLDKIIHPEGGDSKRIPKKKDSIHVVIASPGDAVNERKMLIDHLETRFRKDGHENHCGIRIIVHGWEELASQPGYGQDLINDKIIKECDFVVAVFRHKLGTPTKNVSTGVQRAESGTAEELLQSLDSTKKGFPIGMLYYYSKAPLISIVDKSLKSIQKEFKRLESFKKAIQDKILYKSFEDDEDLIKKVLQDLEKNIIDYFINTSDEKNNKFIENRRSMLLV